MSAIQCTACGMHPNTLRHASVPGPLSSHAFKEAHMLDPLLYIRQGDALDDGGTQ